VTAEDLVAVNRNENKAATGVDAFGYATSTHNTMPVQRANSGSREVDNVKGKL
jgi:hypothetical protein